MASLVPNLKNRLMLTTQVIWRSTGNPDMHTGELLAVLRQNEANDQGHVTPLYFILFYFLHIGILWFHCLCSFFSAHSFIHALLIFIITVHLLYIVYILYFILCII